MTTAWVPEWSKETEAGREQVLFSSCPLHQNLDSKTSQLLQNLQSKAVEYFRPYRFPDTSQSMTPAKTLSEGHQDPHFLYPQMLSSLTWWHHTLRTSPAVSKWQGTSPHQPHANYALISHFLSFPKFWIFQSIVKFWIWSAIFRSIWSVILFWWIVAIFTITVLIWGKQYGWYSQEVCTKLY